MWLLAFRLTVVGLAPTSWKTFSPPAMRLSAFAGADVREGEAVEKIGRAVIPELFEHSGYVTLRERTPLS